MNQPRVYFQEFLARSGSYVLIASILARLLSFLASWFALQLIDHVELGIVIFAFNIISFFIPIGGFGLHQSLIRYGALAKTDKEKNDLFIYTLRKGLNASFILILLIIVGSFVVQFSFEKTRIYLITLSFIIVPMYFFELIKIQFRLKHDNKNFAYSELVYNIILVITVLILSHFYSEKGYVAALLLTPILTSILFLGKLKINYKDYQKLTVTNFAFYKYGFFASLSNVVTQLLFVIDIILIGYLLNDAEMITNYKYVSLIPLSILFLPRAFIATDFVFFTEKIYDKNYIKKYVIGYISFFSIISLATLCVSFFFSDEILQLFGQEFKQYTDSFLILIMGVCGILMLRGLFGNLLSSIGKAHINYAIASIALVINIISNYYLIPIYGIKGAAITSAALMWFTGIISCVWFYLLYHNINASKT